MAEFIPTYSLKDFQRVAELGKLRELKSCEIADKDGYIFSFVNGNMGENTYLRTQTEYICQTINGAYGSGYKTIEEILGLGAELLDFPGLPITKEKPEPRYFEYYCSKCGKNHRKESLLGHRHLKHQRELAGVK